MCFYHRKEKWAVTHRGEKNQYISEWAKNVTIKKKSLMFMRARVERDGMSSQFHTEMYALPPASLFVLSRGGGGEPWPSAAVNILL